MRAAEFVDAELADAWLHESVKRTLDMVDALRNGLSVFLTYRNYEIIKNIGDGLNCWSGALGRLGGPHRGPRVGVDCGLRERPSVLTNLAKHRL